MPHGSGGNLHYCDMCATQTLQCSQIYVYTYLAQCANGNIAKCPIMQMERSVSAEINIVGNTIYQMGIVEISSSVIHVQSTQS